MLSRGYLDRMREMSARLGSLDIRPIGQLDAYSVYEFRCEFHSCMNGQNDWWSDVVISD